MSNGFNMLTSVDDDVDDDFDFILYGVLTTKSDTIGVIHRDCAIDRYSYSCLLLSFIALDISIAALVVITACDVMWFAVFQCVFACVALYMFG